jgi:dipeptidyl aminopeptidase/acylaminoacyl peptidase
MLIDHESSAGTSRPTVEPYLRVTAATNPVWWNEERIAFISDATGVPQVWQVALRTSETTQLTHFLERVGALVASPSGARLVFGMDAGGDERQQLWLIDGDSAPRALTNDPATIHNLGRLSPDGRRLAFASNDRDPRFFDVSVLDLDEPTATPRRVMATDETLTPVAWSPDGSQVLVYRQNTNLDGDLLLVPADGGPPRLLTPHTGEASIGTATFHPDGRSILYLGNQDRENVAVLCLDPETGESEPLVALDWDIEGLALSQDGSWIAYVVNEDGASRLLLRSTTGDEERRIEGLPLGIVEGVTWSPSGKQLAFSVGGPKHPASIWVCDLAGAAGAVATPGLAGLDANSFVEPEIVRYPTFDGRGVPAFWYTPTATPGPWPVVIDVHGGPEGQRRIKYDALTQFLLARGFAVLAPNVRGSTGYGKTYCHLDDVEKRMDAVADVAAAVAWLNARPDVVTGKIAVYGVSYGGFMVLASLTTYPDLWAAGVDVVGIANFHTFFAQTGPWRRRLRACEYGDPERDAELLREISPLHRADRITAPLFVIHGQNDPRVPVGEAEQIVSTLRGLGRDVELRVYDDEGHGLVKLPNRIDGYGAVADFLGRVLGA